MPRVKSSSISDALTLPEILVQRAAAPVDRWSITFLDSTGRESDRWTARDLDARSGAIAACLEATTKPRDPVLLVFQPGPDFLAAFMACMRTARFAVPINPPRRNRLIGRLEAVARDSGARLALSETGLAGAVAHWQSDSPIVASIDWHYVDQLAASSAVAEVDIAPDDLAFIQYTSGSTAQPKGVMVTHRNLVEDMSRMADAWAISEQSVMVSWLPAFHDLGLIFGLLQPLYCGCATVQLAPNSFLQRPRLWLEAISRYRGTHSAAPSFAYDLCCRRIRPDERDNLDLTSLVMTMNAAEPIHPEVIDRFALEFADCGFRRKTFAPAYGLAESTLAVTANPVDADPVSIRLDRNALERHVARQVSDEDPDGRVLSGCGAPLPDVPIAIVDPETRRRLPVDRIGEIWVGGPTIAEGYWQREDETAETFGASIMGEEPAITYLRTGDLGVMIDGELFVTGRIKDLIILSGNNHYPQDIERVVQASHPALRVDNGAAFSIEDEDGVERVAVVQEIERTRRKSDTAPIFEAMAAAAWQELEIPIARMALIEPGAVLRTSSGKIQRLANRQAYLAGDLPTIAEWHASTVRSPEQPRPAVVKETDNKDPASLRAWIVAWLAARLELPTERIAADRGFAELGLESIASVQLAFDLGEQLGRELPETLAFDYPTVTSLAEHLTADAPALPSTVPSGARPGAMGSDLEELLSAIERSEI
jgi:acyl-CoA synthetase (AMP-forming)/AMP-acid ligase II/acyl carrier protein